MLSYGFANAGVMESRDDPVAHPFPIDLVTLVIKGVKHRQSSEEGTNG
jgi:hypothetical protein